MTVACLVLIAGLCFEGHTVKAEVANFGLGYSAEVTGEQYVVRTGGTDVVQMHDFRKAPKACADGVCVRYVKSCQPAHPAGIECRYAVVWPGIVPDGGISVTAASAEALATAGREVSIVVERDGKSAKLPLSALDVTADAHTLADCPAGMSFDACDPP
ncbi:MAG: hypothetical protein WDN03_11890 [Rhizomicrobium sp.]